MLDGVAEKGILAGATVAGTASLVVAVTTKSNTGPWLAFAGALIVAVLTAVFTQRRQAQQLAAEERRLKIQLEHERQLRDVSELREVLTEAVETVMQASDRFVDLRVAFAHADAKERSEALAEQQSEAMNNVTASLIALQAAYARLAVRGQIAVGELALDIMQAIPIATEAPREDEKGAEAFWSNADTELSGLQNQFLTLVEGYARLDLPKEIQTRTQRLEKDLRAHRAGKSGGEGDGTQRGPKSDPVKKPR